MPKHTASSEPGFPNQKKHVRNTLQACFSRSVVTTNNSNKGTNGALPVVDSPRIVRNPRKRSAGVLYEPQGDDDELSVAQTPQFVVNSDEKTILQKSGTKEREDSDSIDKQPVRTIRDGRIDGVRVRNEEEEEEDDEEEEDEEEEDEEEFDPENDLVDKELGDDASDMLIVSDSPTNPSPSSPSSAPPPTSKAATTTRRTAPRYTRTGPLDRTGSFVMDESRLNPLTRSFEPFIVEAVEPYEGFLTLGGGSEHTNVLNPKARLGFIPKPDGVGHGVCNYCSLIQIDFRNVEAQMEAKLPPSQYHMARLTIRNTLVRFMLRLLAPAMFWQFAYAEVARNKSAKRSSVEDCMEGVFLKIAPEIAHNHFLWAAKNGFPSPPQLCSIEGNKAPFSRVMWSQLLDLFYRMAEENPSMFDREFHFVEVSEVRTGQTAMRYPKDKSKEEIYKWFEGRPVVFNILLPQGGIRMFITIMGCPGLIVSWFLSCVLEEIARVGIKHICSLPEVVRTHFAGVDPSSLCNTSPTIVVKPFNAVYVTRFPIVSEWRVMNEIFMALLMVDGFSYVGTNGSVFHVTNNERTIKDFKNVGMFRLKLRISSECMSSSPVIKVNGHYSSEDNTMFLRAPQVFSGDLVEVLSAWIIKMNRMLMTMRSHETTLSSYCNVEI